MKNSDYYPVGFGREDREESELKEWFGEMVYAIASFADFAYESLKSWTRRRGKPETLETMRPVTDIREFRKKRRKNP